MSTIIIYNGCADTGWCCDELKLVTGSSVTLDLRLLTFVGPLFLVRLRAWLEHHVVEGLDVIVLPPDSPSASNYMSRMHLLDGLEGAITFPLPTVRENDLGDRLIPLTKLTAGGQHEFDDLLGDLLASPDMRGAGFLANVVTETAQEMALNAVWHGTNPVGAYVVAQRFRDRQSNLPHRCVLAIGDLGIGMAAHLRGGGHGQENDSATIARGMTDMVSGTGDEYRGHGYTVPFDIARQDAASQVDLRVRANSGWVRKRGDGEPQALPRPASDCIGTWVEFTFMHSTPVT